MSRSNQISSSFPYPRLVLVGSRAHAERQAAVDRLFATYPPQPRHMAAAEALSNLAELDEASVAAILEEALAPDASVPDRSTGRVFRPPLRVVREPLAVRLTEAEPEPEAGA